MNSMSSNVSLWLKSIGTFKEGVCDNLPTVECKNILQDIIILINKNLRYYEVIFEPLINNPHLKNQVYFLCTTITIFINQQTGGDISNEADSYIRTMLVSFIDIIVDNPEYGIDIAYGVGLYIFKGVKFDIPENLKHDTEHVKSIIDSVENKGELLSYMLSLGEIEKKISRCRDLDEYIDLRLHSNCVTGLDLCNWVDDSVAYSICTMGAIIDDILDMSTDPVVYITEDNLDYYLDKIRSCIQIWGIRAGYNMDPYSKIIVIILKAIAKFTFEDREGILEATKGFKLLILCLIIISLTVSIFRKEFKTTV